jgi:hypothetical protein
MSAIMMVAILTLNACCSLLVTLSALAQDSKAALTKPLLVLTGADSHVIKPAYQRITSEAAWQQLWLSHLGKTEADSFREHLPIVQIDFEKCMLIAVFRGVATNSRGVNVISVEEQEASVCVRFDDMSYQTAGGFGDDAGGSVKVTPYAMIVIPKSTKLVVLEENVQGLKNQPPTWKERARLKTNEAQ